MWESVNKTNPTEETIVPEEQEDQENPMNEAFELIQAIRRNN